MFWLIYPVAMLLAAAGFIAALYVYSTVEDMLEDHLNPVTTCSLLNAVIPFELGIQAALCGISIWQIWLFLWNLAMLFFDFWQIATRETAGQSGLTLYDPTRILRRDKSRWLKTVSIGKCCYYAASLLLYLAVFICGFYTHTE